MTIKKGVRIFHLFLGLSSGLVILFLGITGCILAFELEIREFTEPFQFVNTENKSCLLPSVLTLQAEKYLDGNKISGIEYRAIGRSAVASYYSNTSYTLVYLNPYTGDVIKVKDMNHDFFRFILMGHYYLWLPPNIGKPFVASATLIFLFMMLSGIVLWWPKNKAALKQKFTIKWSARWRRKNYDLHSVMGFYMCWIAIFLAISALVMGFQWFAKSVYWLSSAGKSIPAYTSLVSDTTGLGSSSMSAGDRVWIKLSKDRSERESVVIYFPTSKTATVAGNINHRPGTFYNTDYHQFDQYTTKELAATGIYAGKFREAPLASKINRMNYDIHVGAVLGLPGKILAFCASLVAASLPITGFSIWLGRRKKSAGYRRQF